MQLLLALMKQNAMDLVHHFEIDLQWCVEETLEYNRLHLPSRTSHLLDIVNRMGQIIVEICSVSRDSELFIL